MMFTKTEQRIIDVLADGEFHRASELLAAIDAYAEMRNLHAHLANIRHKLNNRGQGLISDRIDTVLVYRHVHLVPVRNSSD